MNDLHPQAKAIIDAAVLYSRHIAERLRRELQSEAGSEQAILYLDGLIATRQRHFEEKAAFDGLIGGVKRGEKIVIADFDEARSLLTERLLNELLAEKTAADEKAQVLKVLEERIGMHDEAYRQLINGRITLDRVIVDELAGCDLKPKRKSYGSPYYPDSAQRKARKARR